MAGKAASIIPHIAIAVIIAYGLSVFFWLGLGVFNPVGFLFVSGLAATLGVITGWALNKRLWITALITLICRLGLYVFMTGGL